MEYVPFSPDMRLLTASIGDDTNDGNGMPSALLPCVADVAPAGASAASQKGVYDNIANSYPNTHLVLAHSVHTTSTYRHDRRPRLTR